MTWRRGDRAAVYPSLPARPAAGSSARTATMPHQDRRGLAQFALLGCGLIAITLVYLSQADLPRHYQTPLWDLNDLGDWRVVGSCFVLLLGLAFGCYLTAWRLVRRLRPTRAHLVWICMVPAVISVLLWLSYPLFSHDVFYSMMTGRVVASYQENPFQLPPAAFANDPFLPYADWQRLTAPYGPLWIMLSGGLSQIAGDSLLLNLLAFKGFAVIAFFGTTALLALLLAWLHPDRLMSGLVLWSWNPLVLLETAGNGHNDIGMLALLLLAFYLAFRSRATLALVAVVLAVALKYVAILLLPLMVAFLTRDAATWRVKCRIVLPGLLLAAAVLMLLFAPFWVGRSSLGFLNEAQVYYGSPMALGWLLLGAEDRTTRVWLLRGAVVLTVAAVYPGLLRQAARDSTHFLRACAVALLLALLLWSYFAPWYVLWIAAPAAALATKRVGLQLIAFTGAAATTYLFQYSLRQAYPVPTAVWSVLTALAVVGSPLVVMFTLRVRQRRASPILVRPRSALGAVHNSSTTLSDEEGE